MKVRPYRMRARAESAAATAERILDAAEALFWEDPVREPTLAMIAGRAGLSTQTVIRRFGGREGVEAAARQRAVQRVEAERSDVVPGDLRGAVAVLVSHYEERGVKVLRLLADESRSEQAALSAAAGRELHAQWCERVFAPTLEGLEGPGRARRLAQLVAVCDVYTWKVLRRDRALGPRQTARALTEMLEPLVRER